MNTRLDEIAAGIYRVSVYIPEADFMFNQFLVDGEEPLMFHTGPRRLFPIVSEAINQVRPIHQLRWITFGHLEADECGAMNLFLAAAPRAEVAHGRLGCEVNIDDLADRPPRPLDNGDVIDTGTHRLRYIATPMSRTLGTRASTTTRPPAPCSVATCSPQLAKVTPWPAASWSGRPYLRKTCSRPPV
jgi:glyoxylase-like metal-dependent hydrolase (beta-lactamase superfamily II)